MTESRALPAVCDTCGTVFPSGINLGPGATGTIQNVKAGPCPACNGMGTIPDGVYGFFLAVREEAQSLRRRERRDLARQVAAIAKAPQEQQPGMAADLPFVARMLRAAEPKEPKDFLLYLAVIIYVLLAVAGRAPEVPEVLKEFTPGASSASGTAQQPAAPEAPDQPPDSTP